MLFCVWFCSRSFGSGSRVCVLSEVEILPKASGAAVKHGRAIKTRQPRAAQADSQCAPHYGCRGTLAPREDKLAQRSSPIFHRQAQGQGRWLRRPVQLVRLLSQSWNGSAHAFLSPAFFCFRRDIKVPAKPSSIWYPALISGTMSFTNDYPHQPPKVKFNLVDGKPLFHPNLTLGLLW